MADLTFRYAATRDAHRIFELIERAYRGPDAELGWTTETHLLEGPRTRAEEIDALVIDPESRFVLAEADGMLVGCALIQRNTTRAYFGMFAVDPQRQAGGIGKALLSACEESARDLWAAQQMTMSVISLRADLIEWYVRRGYRRTGTSEPFPLLENSGELRRDFDLVHLCKSLST